MPDLESDLFNLVMSEPLKHYMNYPNLAPQHNLHGIWELPGIGSCVANRFSFFRGETWDHWSRMNLVQRSKENLALPSCLAPMKSMT